MIQWTADTEPWLLHNVRGWLPRHLLWLDASETLSLPGFRDRVDAANRAEVRSALVADEMQGTA